MGKTIDLTGKRFGRLTVIEPAERPEFTTATSSFWRARCDCGNEVVVDSSNLRKGYTRSCGCLRRENMARMRQRRLAKKEEREHAVK